MAKVKKLLSIFILLSLFIGIVPVVYAGTCTNLPDPINLSDRWTLYEDKCTSINEDAFHKVTPGIQCDMVTHINNAFNVPWDYQRNTGFNLGDDVSITYYNSDMDVQGFIVRSYYPEKSSFYFKFYISKDAQNWTEITNSVMTQKGEMEAGMMACEFLHYIDKLPSGYKYLKVAFPNDDNSQYTVWQQVIGNVKIWYGNNKYSAVPFTYLGDLELFDCSDISQFEENSNLQNITIEDTDIKNYHYDTGRLKVTSGNSLVCKLQNDTMSGFTVWMNLPENSEKNPNFYISKNGVDFQPIEIKTITNQGTVAGETIERVCYIDKMPANMKYLKVSFDDISEGLQVGQIALVASKLAYSTEEIESHIESGKTIASAIVNNRLEKNAPATIVAVAMKDGKEVIRTKKVMIPPAGRETISVEFPFETSEVQIFVCDTLSEFHDITSYPYDLYEMNFNGFELQDNLMTLKGRLGTSNNESKYIYAMIVDTKVTDEQLNSETLDENTISYIGFNTSFTRNGSFSKVIEFPTEYVLPGEYKYRIAASGRAEVITGTFVIASAQQKTDAMNNLNTQSELSLIFDDANSIDRKVLTYTYKVNMPGYDELPKAGKDEVLKEVDNLRDDAPFSPDDVASRINLLIFESRINFAETVNQVKARIPEITDVMDDFQNDSDYLMYTVLPDKYKDWLCELIIRDKAFADIDEFIAAFRDYVALQRFNAATYDLMEGLLDENFAKIFSANDSVYNKYKQMSRYNRAEVGKLLIDQHYLLYSDIKTKFYAAVKEIQEKIDEEAKKQKTTPGSGGGTTGFAIGNSLVQVISDTDITPKSYFSDLGDTEWARVAVSYLADKNVVCGDNDGRFRPNDNIKREEFLKMLVCAFNIRANGTGIPFSDVKPDEWYYNYVLSAYVNGITNGYGEKFGIGDYITRQDMCVMVNRTVDKLGKKLGNSPSGKDFCDFELISDYAKESVNQLSNYKIISGNETGEFLPKNNTTRAEAAVVLYNVLKAIRDMEAMEE